MDGNGIVFMRTSWYKTQGNANIWSNYLFSDNVRLTSSICRAIILVRK